MRIILISLLLLTSAAAADESNLERYGALPIIQKMTVSPDGQKIAFRVVDEERDLISVVSVAPVKPISTFSVSNVKPRFLSFLDNNNVMMSMSAQKSVPGFRGEFEMSVGATYNLKKKKYSQLLVAGKNDVYAAQSSLDRVVGISPDGKSVYMPAYSGEPSFSMGQQISSPLSLFKVKINGDGRARIHKRGRGGTLDYFVGNDGNVLARETFDEEKNIHRIVALHGKKPVEIFSDETPYLTKSFIGVSLDENALFMVDQNRRTDRSALYKLHLADGKIEGPVLEKANTDIVDYITDKQRKLLGVRYSGFKPSYRFFDADLNQRVTDILAKFPGHSVWVEEVTADLNHVLVRVEGSQATGDYFLYSKGKEASFISSRRPDISAQEIHPIAPVTFAARDGLKIPTLITVPRDRVSDLKNLPAIMMPHGGPHSYDAIGFDFLAQALADQGYLVIQPQFRGSIGFGAEHQSAGYGEWGGKALSDLTDAVDFFSKQGMVDRSRVCIVGASYGGYSALAGGAFTPNIYQCVVSINGIGNLNDMLNRVRNDRGRASSSLAFWEAQILGFEETNRDIAKQRSPELAASEFVAPVLLIHSENDENVHPRQSVKMFKALKKAGKQVDKVELKNEDHYLSRGETRLLALQKIVSFVNKNLAP